MDKEKQFKDVQCPRCDGSGEVSVGAPAPYDHWTRECERCGGTGNLKIKIEHCKGCAEELEWREFEYPYDEETDTVYQCKNKCEESIIN